MNWFTGSPIFVHGNSNVKSVELYKPLTLSFLLYSYPIVEEIWIEGVASSYTINETIHDFRIEKRKLLFSEIENNKVFSKIGNNKGYEFAFEIKILSNEYEMYKIWTKNRLGEDSFSFSIRAVGKIILGVFVIQLIIMYTVNSYCFYTWLGICTFNMRLFNLVFYL